MSDREDSVEGEPPSIDPYEVLGLERTATADDVKKAYRKAALKHHPDKVADSERFKAHETFQAVAFAYAVLSDPARRKRYDATGSTAESIVDADGFDWSDFYREQFRDAVSGDAIERFARAYRGSDEERDDVLAAYERCAGDMDALFEHVVLSRVIDDEERFRAIIDRAVADGDVSEFKAYAKEPRLKRAARLKRARAEAAEAEDYAKELGVHEEIFGGGAKKGEKKGGKGGKGGGSEDALAALIQRRQQDRSESFFDHLEAKYGAPGKGKKGKKRVVGEEPSEEAFQAAAAKLKNGSKKRRE
ncbi:DnaJ domain protein [Cordyceps fumosorosea ARSEF 2679]|uniref:DnaJ domain protein n=1 Tax=Cordyceps fumosorosea (strain ARSEF 2679) TaxID=1081104 RepID=A0A168BL39_CORFA|nr:DnaJ domain protein [Cordyceps fumosorosea ARSEF 2679]OAA70255.1 DnaJ domain protein [Cordyceps fumosorosea ARSEF 2679]